MFDRKWDVVSLRTGAASAAKEVKEQLEFLEGYENVVLCFDNDKAGEIATESIKALFSPNKLKICKLPMKDPSEMLVANKIRDFTAAWWDAKVHRPDGIVAGSETWDHLINSRKVKSIPYPWAGLNELVKGVRPFELVTITSGSGMGKSQLVKEVEYFLFNATEDNIGILALEESLSRTTLGIMSMAANKPLHLDEDADTLSFKPYWDSTLGSNRFFMLDHWGSTGEDTLMSQIRYLAKAMDCKWIILDHLSIVVSSQEGGDERKNIDAIMTKLRTLVQELGVGLFLVSHLKRSSGQAHEDGGKISLSELRGSQAIAQLSDIVLGLERDQQHDDEAVRNTTTLRVLKNRYTGLTGPACYLKYDKVTGRMLETNKPAEVINGDF
jgi:twinkle protein